MRRAIAIESWFAASQSGALLTSGRTLNLSQLFQPGTFLNALRQQTARVLRQPLDTLQLVTAWDTSKLRNAELAVQIDGLQIQGAAFEGVRLMPVDATAPVSQAAPATTIAWVPKGTPAVYPCSVAVPLYLNSERSKVLTEMQVPVVAQDEVPQWVLAGVAMFLMD